MRSTDDQPPGLHRDPITGRTVFVAPGRARRPNESAGDTIRCPFCAGNEALTPPPSLQTPGSPAALWRARIVPNRFPIVLPTAGPAVGQAPAGPAAAGVPRPAAGVHEVVIESPEHVRSILSVDSADWRAVWELCRERLATLADQQGLVWATIFKNSGGRAGASLEHVHSQLVALDFVPQAIEVELAAAEAAEDLFGDLVRTSEAEGRVVEEAGDLVAVVPPAPRQPFEAWILPRVPELFFHATTGGRVEALAVLTQSLIRRLDALVPGADYNWWLHQPPFTNRSTGIAGRSVPSRWHWHLEIMPRINGLAGFELGTGCHITTATPQESARLLREA